MRPNSAKLAKYRVFCGYTWKTPGYTWTIPCDRLGIVPISSILPQILPQTSSQTQGKQRVSRMEHQTPSVFPGNFRKRKVLGTLCFPFCFPENLVEPTRATGGGRVLRLIACAVCRHAKTRARSRCGSAISGGLVGTSEHSFA